MEKLILPRDSNLSPKVSLWFAQLQEVRNYLIEIVEKLTQQEIDFTPNERKAETIGTLLLHIAAVEWSWIFEDIDGLEMDFDWSKEAFALRPNVNIPQIKGKEKKFYLDKLETVRNQVYQRLKDLKDEELENKITAEGVEISIEWILFHLIEHEAMHVGQILLLKRLKSKEN